MTTDPHEELHIWYHIVKCVYFCNLNFIKLFEVEMNQFWLISEINPPQTVAIHQNKQHQNGLQGNKSHESTIDLISLPMPIVFLVPVDGEMLFDGKITSIGWKFHSV